MVVTAENKQVYQNITLLVNGVITNPPISYLDRKITVGGMQENVGGQMQRNNLQLGLSKLL